MGNLNKAATPGPSSPGLLPYTGLLVRFSGIAVETPEGGLAAAVEITPDISSLLRKKIPVMPSTG